MERFRQMLTDLKKLDLDKDNFAIFGSGPLAIRGIRDTEDIDLVVRSDMWKELSQKYPVEKGYVIHVGDIEIYNGWGEWFSDIDMLIDDADVIEGYRFVKLKYVLEWKRACDREKDKKDIVLIEDFLRGDGNE